MTSKISRSSMILLSGLTALTIALPAAGRNHVSPPGRPPKSIPVVEAVPVPYLAHLSAAQVVGERPSSSVVVGAVATRFDLGFTSMEFFLRPENTGDSPVVSASLRCGRPGTVGIELIDLLRTRFPDICEVAGDEFSCTLRNEHLAKVDCTEAIGIPVTNLVSLDHAMHLGLVYVEVGTRGSDPTRGQFTVFEPPPKDTWCIGTASCDALLTACEDEQGHICDNFECHWVGEDGCHFGSQGD